MTTITIERELLEDVVEIFDSAISARFPHEILRDIRAALAAPATAPEPSTEVAVGKLCKSLREDLDYAWTWHCNIAMAAFDAGCPHDVANEGAARFMQLLAGVDTREHPAFQGTQDHPMRNDKTAPAQPALERKPMTDEEVIDLVRECGLDWHKGFMPLFDDDPTNRFAVLVRAVEAFHGIKEQP